MSIDFFLLYVSETGGKLHRLRGWTPLDIFPNAEPQLDRLPQELEFSVRQWDEFLEAPSVFR